MPLSVTDAELIREAIRAKLVDVHTCTVGELVTYDSVTGTATIRLMVKRPVGLGLDDGSIEHEELPLLQDVPVLWPRSKAGWLMHFPLAPGDGMTVYFTEDSIAGWRENGQEGIPGDRRRHSLGSCYAKPDIAPATVLLVDSANTPMPADELVIDGPGKIRLGGSINAKYVALSDLVDTIVSTIQSAFDAHVHPTAMGPSGPPVTPIGALSSTAASKTKAE